MSKEDDLRALREARFVTRPVTDVTKTVTVTPPVTPRLVAPSRLTALEVENEALRQEVIRLKRLLAEANGGKAVAQSAAERMRKMRERRKQQA
jgi:hypothetical protein